MPVSPGDVLTAKRGITPASIRVLGIQDGAFVVENAEGYSAPAAIAPAKLAANYGGDPTLPPDEEDVMRQADAAATEAAANNYFRRVDHAVPRRINIGDDLRDHVARRGHDPRSAEERLAAEADGE